jgi:hypothetical protein
MVADGMVAVGVVADGAGALHPNSRSASALVLLLTMHTAAPTTEPMLMAATA